MVVSSVKTKYKPAKWVTDCSTCGKRQVVKFTTKFIKCSCGSKTLCVKGRR